MAIISAPMAAAETVTFPAYEEAATCLYGCWSINSFQVNIVVPPAPTASDGQAFGFWIGLSDLSQDALVQSLIWWGGPGWSAFTFFCGSSPTCGTYQYGASTPVNVGDEISMHVWYPSKDCWKAQVAGDTTGASPTPLNNNCQYNWGWTMAYANFAFEYHLGSGGECPAQYLPSVARSADPNGNPAPWVYFTDAKWTVSGTLGNTWTGYLDNNCGWEAIDAGSFGGDVPTWVSVAMPT